MADIVEHGLYKHVSVRSLTECIMHELCRCHLAAMHQQRLPVPVTGTPRERLGAETLLPQPRRHRARHQIRVVARAVADEVAEAQLPGGVGDGRQGVVAPLQVGRHAGCCLAIRRVVTVVRLVHQRVEHLPHTPTLLF